MMPQADEPDSDRLEGAPAEVEGPLPPGAPQAEQDDADLEDATVEELRARATELGVMPDEGSGKGGRVVKADLEKALEEAPPAPPAGRPPLAAVAERAAGQIMPREEE
jgi:pyruvate dehydrogenase E2 component (dihydrolipoamide acetyltransferase)